MKRGKQHCETKSIVQSCFSWCCFFNLAALHSLPVDSQSSFHFSVKRSVFFYFLISSDYWRRRRLIIKAKYRGNGFHHYLHHSIIHNAGDTIRLSLGFFNFSYQGRLTIFVVVGTQHLIMNSTGRDIRNNEMERATWLFSAFLPSLLLILAIGVVSRVSANNEGLWFRDLCLFLTIPFILSAVTRTYRNRSCEIRWTFGWIFITITACRFFSD